MDRAASLVKFDLGSQMVTELSSLAGIMAKEYAARGGETPEVARAIFETELPRAAGDELPTSTAGVLLALADRFDLLAGLFAIGAEPTGSSDPFGLRRSAVGLLNILRTSRAVSGITLETGLALAASHQRVPVEAAALDKALQFVVRRFEQQLLEAGHPVSAVRAVLVLSGTPQLAEQTLGELLVLQEQPHFAALLAAVQRVRRIVPADVTAGFDVALFTEAAEEELAASVAKFRELLGDERGPAQVAAHSPVLVASVNRFFDEVLVMDKDPKIKANRLGLLASAKSTTDGVVDWDALD
ncbi:glycine--tRNA ligase subunit beta [Streptomyces sp. NPDC060035]|uniref:glycine--tRNA ligase subunit beta n=1 Tax=Streptomyces sp. NPDC060035 TaxID=3347044 RepID=UPI00368BB393